MWRFFYISVSRASIVSQRRISLVFANEMHPFSGEPFHYRRGIESFENIVSVINSQMLRAIPRSLMNTNYELRGRKARKLWRLGSLQPFSPPFWLFAFCSRVAEKKFSGLCKSRNKTMARQPLLKCISTEAHTQTVSGCRNERPENYGKNICN